MQAQLLKDIHKDGSNAFPLVVAVPNLRMGLPTVIQAYGIGSLKANTILLNWLEKSSQKVLGNKEHDFSKNLRTALMYGCNIILLEVKTDKWTAIEETEEQKRFIDVWWWGDATSRLMLLLAYLMTRHEKWDQSKIRLLAVADIDQSNLTDASIKEMLEEVRIEANPEIVTDVDADRLAEYSADSALVFIPFRIKNNMVVDPFDNPMADTLFLLPVTAMVLAAKDIELVAEPEEGEAGDAAKALDALEDAKKREQKTAKEAEQAAIEAQKAREKAEDIASGSKGADASTEMAAEKEAEEAEKEAIKLARKAAKAAAKAESASREAEAAGVLPEETEESKDE